MKGPSDISDILSGIKTTTINIQSRDNKDSSTISLSNARDMENTNNATMPKRSLI